MARYGNRSGRPGRLGPTRQEKVEELVGVLEAETAATLTSEAFAAWLRTLAKFHKYSWGNVCLIHRQRPDATRVAGYGRWQEVKRQVRKGERGIRVLAPLAYRREDEATGEVKSGVAGFRVATVFDVSQTDGEELPEGPPVVMPEGDTGEGAFLLARVTEVVKQRGALVRFDAGDAFAHPTAKGYYRPGDGKRAPEIVVRADLPADMVAKVMVHEACHFLAGHDKGKEFSAADAETVAEGAAYAVAAYFGLDTSGYSFGYVVGWAGDVAVVKRNLGAIRAVVHEFIDAIEGPAAAPDQESVALAAD